MPSLVFLAGPIAGRRYKIGDGDCKKRLAEVLNAFLEPIRRRRAEHDANPQRVTEVLRDATARATAVAEQTHYHAKYAMHFDIFSREF